MNTWNTMAPPGLSKLERAVTFLETLNEPRNRLILDYLQAYRKASLTDLLIASKLDPRILERQLAHLSGTGIIFREESKLGGRYTLNRRRLWAIVRISKQLAQAYRA